MCGSRIFVQKGIYEKFKNAFVKKINALKVGSPYEEDTNIGALVSESHIKKVESYIALAKEEGGTVISGGERVKLTGKLANGWYLRPTVLEGLAFDCRVNQEEIFGPVVTIMPFDDTEDVLMMANSTGYGLASTVWTSNLKKAHNMAEKIEAGICWINCWMVRDLRTPFGGIKNSGVGREGGFEALNFFTEPKNVCIKL